MRKLLALLAVCTLVACDTRNGLSVAPLASELGAFSARSVNGLPLPYVLSPAGASTKREVVADTIFLLTGKIAREVFYTRSTTGTSAPLISMSDQSVNYSIVGDSIDLSGLGFSNGRYTGGTTLTLVDGIGTWIYQK